MKNVLRNIVRSVIIESMIDDVFKNANAEKVKLSKEQKAALKAYNFAVSQEDRYSGSVFANSAGIKKYEEAVKKAYDECKRLGMDHRHGL